MKEMIDSVFIDRVLSYIQREITKQGVVEECEEGAGNFIHCGAANNIIQGFRVALSHPEKMNILINDIINSEG